jgi:hypothetical protein
VESSCFHRQPALAASRSNEQAIQREGFMGGFPDRVNTGVHSNHRFKAGRRRTFRQTMTDDILIIGGGIVGLATAFRLLEARPGLRLVLLEKENALARHQTGNNSGVLHAGLYYMPGSAKAQLAVQGLQQMVAFCREHSISHEQCGKIVVATSEAELPRLENLWQRGNPAGAAQADAARD